MIIGAQREHFGDPRDEYEAVKTRAALEYRPTAGKIEVSGADRVKFLQGMLTNDVKRLAPGAACRAALLDAKGRVHGLVNVLAEPERLWLETPPEWGGRTLDWLSKYVISDDVQLAERTLEFAAYAVFGPKAEQAFRHFKKPFPDAKVFRTDEYGAPTFSVWVPVLDDERARAELAVAGAKPVGTAMMETLRVEAGRPALGAELDGTVLLPEAGLDELVSYEKGCYLGQEIVARVKYRGHANRKVAALVLEGTEPAVPGDLVTAGGAEVGKVTSAAWSTGLGRAAALALLKVEAAQPGAAVEAGGRKARVAALPLGREAAA